MARSCGWAAALVLLGALCLPPSAVADEVKDGGDAGDNDRPTDPMTLLMDFELDAQQVVEEAAKTRRTIQETPAIITVITAKEIRDRGHRTIYDVLRTIPGFEGDRWEMNGWFKDVLTRGQPRTALVLLDGVNIVDPLRNTVVLDRKIPLDNVRRIEVTSGPGSVLWGSNALLGIINIITHDGRTKPGWTVRAGGGDGPGARRAARVYTSYGGSWADGLVRLFVGGTWYTTEGPELTLDQPKLFGPFPQPAPDGSSLFARLPGESEPFARDHFLNVAGRLSVGPVTMGWSVGYEAETREISIGGSLLANDYRDPESSSAVGPERLIARGSDQMHTGFLRFNDRFLQQKLGVNAQAYFVYWEVDEDPLGVYPRMPLLEWGATTALSSDGLYRSGLNVDLDYELPWDNRLLFGAEVFGDFSEDILLTSFSPLHGPGATNCSTPFEHQPASDPNRPCSTTDAALTGTERVIAALYLKDEWKISSRVAVEAGVRGQFATTYSPAVLLSGGFVFGLSENVFIKAAYQEGFRPPDFQSTSTSEGMASGVNFESNPDLDVERSHALEVQAVARLFEGWKPVRRLSVRADYSYTRMNNVVSFPAGRYVNSGARDIHGVGLTGKLHFYGDHELWLSYSFVDVVDSEIGRLRNIANHVINAGGRLSFFQGRLRLATVLTVRGTMEDLNRTTLAPTPASGILGAAVPDAVEVLSTGLEVTEIPTAVLWRLGIEGRKLFGVWGVGAWVYNVLDDRYSDADFFFDDRIMSRPQPKPGLAFFVETGVEW